MGQQSLSFMNQEIEKALEEIKQAEEAVGEQPAGNLRYDNICRLDRAKEVLMAGEANLYRGYKITTEIELVRHLISLVYKNLK